MKIEFLLPPNLKAQLHDPNGLDAALQGWYGGEERRYHNLAHIEDCLWKLWRVQHLVSMLDAGILGLAFLYHDAVYDIRQHDNEERSAELLVNTAPQYFGVSYQYLVHAANLVVATKATKTPTNDVESVLLDIDNSILGASHDQYERYAHNIEDEFTMFRTGYSFSEFYAGRAQFLRNRLVLPRQFHTAPFVEAFEQHARQNMERELASITLHTGSDEVQSVGH